MGRLQLRELGRALWIASLPVPLGGACTGRFVDDSSGGGSAIDADAGDAGGDGAGLDGATGDGDGSDGGGTDRGPVGDTTGDTGGDTDGGTGGACVELVDSVRPLLDARCGACHGGAAPLGGLALDDWSGIAAGGTSGPAVVAGQPEQSPLWQKVALATPPVGVRMPQVGGYLADAEVELLGRWIAHGAEASFSDPTRARIRRRRR